MINAAPAIRSYRAAPESWTTRLVHLPALWIARFRQRRSLAELDAYMRHDLGLSAGDVEREATKPFWRG